MMWDVTLSNASKDLRGCGRVLAGAIARQFVHRSRWELFRGAFFTVLSVFALWMTILLFQAGLAKGGSGFDALCYWSVNPSNPYGGQYGGVNFAYAPPLALAFMPTHLISFDAFRGIWLVVNCAALAWLGRRYALLLLLFFPVGVELFNGNIHLLMAMAIVVGFRYPAAWSFLLLTKVTPGIGLLWFVVRKEWRNLAVALGTTAAISLVSLVVVPDMWRQWLTFLASNPTADTPLIQATPPLPLRLLVAAAVVTYGARTDRRWMVAVAATIALPLYWWNGFSVLVAILPLWKGDVDARRRAADAAAPAAASSASSASSVAARAPAAPV
jgi:hypothetical protein